MQYLYKNWAYMGPFIALYTLIVILCNMDTMGSLIFWIWLQFPIYLIHEFEEHVFPGKFKVFINKEIFHASKNIPLDDKKIFWSNIIAIWFVFPTCAALAQTVSPAYGILIVYFALFNASTHILIACILRKYNPGLLASIFLNYPSGLYVLWLAYQNGILTPFLNIASFLFAFLGHALIIIYVFYYYKQYKNTLKRA